MNTNTSIRAEAAKVKEKLQKAKTNEVKKEPLPDKPTPSDVYVAPEQAAKAKSKSKSKSTSAAPKEPKVPQLRYLPQDPGMQPLQTTPTDLRPDLTNDRFKISESNSFKQPKADEDGNFIFSVNDTRFDGVNAFHIANETLKIAEKYAGRSIPWGFADELGRNQIILHPHLLKDEPNAFYSSETGSINLSHYVNRDGQTERTAQQADVVSHETGHGILDGMRPAWLHSMSVASGGFHESFGDMMSILKALHEDTVIDSLKEETGGQLLIPNVVSSVGEQIGHTIYGDKAHGLRQAINDTQYADSSFLPFMDRQGDYHGLGTECHAYSKLFTAAFYDIFNGIYQEENKSPDCTFRQAVTNARDEAGKLLFRAIDLSPVGDISYKDMALSFLKADMQDNEGKHVEQIAGAFVSRSILTEEDLSKFMAKEMLKGETPKLRFNDKFAKAEFAEKFVDKNREALGLPEKAEFKFQSLRTTDDGHKYLTFTTNKDQLLEGSEWGLYEGAKLRSQGGLQLVFDPKGKLADSQFDPVTSDELEEAALNFRRNIGVGGIVDGAMPSQSKPDEHLPKLHIQTLTEGDSRVIRRAPVVYCGHGSGCNCGGIQP